jgi:hypothetical protein
MRIAVAGTHRSGKTSLVEAFGQAHPEYRVVPEPYEGLQEDLGEDPFDDLTPEAFQRQLEYMVELLIVHPTTESAIFDRCPLDFLAYLRAIDELDLGDSDWSVSGAVLQAIEAGLRELDLIVFVRPDRDRHPKSGNVRRLQGLVDTYLYELLIDDVLGLLRGADAPAVNELEGSTARRVATLSRFASAGEIGDLDRGGVSGVRRSSFG